MKNAYINSCKMMRDQIKNKVKNGERQFIIFPYSGNGMTAHEILKMQFNIEPAYIIDNSLCNINSQIHPSLLLSQLDSSKYILLLASESERWCEEIRYEAYRTFPSERILDLFWDIYPHDVRISWLRRYALIVHKSNIPGNVAECGVWQGDFAYYINRFFEDRKCYLFDSFEGFRGEDIQKEQEIQKSTFFDHIECYKTTSVDYVLGKMSRPEMVIVKKGYVPESLFGLDDYFCFVSLDMDFYLPMLEALKYFYPRITRGGNIIT